MLWGATALSVAQETMGLLQWEAAEGGADSPRRKVPFYTAKFSDQVALRQLAGSVLTREAEIKARHPSAMVGGAESIENSLTSRYYAYNVLTWPEDGAQALMAFFKSAYLAMLADMPLIQRRRTYIQCWANTVRKGERVHIHNHGDKASFFSGNLAVQVEDYRRSRTHYTVNPKSEDPADRFSVLNEPGLLTIFPSWVLHYTDPWPNEEVRISIAFDLVDEATFERQKTFRVRRRYIPFDGS